MAQFTHNDSVSAVVTLMDANRHETVSNDHFVTDVNRIRNDMPLGDIDQNQLTTNSEDLRNLSKEVREFVLNPIQFKSRTDVKRGSCSSKEGSRSIYDQNEEHQRFVINREVNRRQEQHISSIDDNWGWIVVLGSLVCMVFVDGICFTYGLHCSHIKSYFSLSAMSSVILPGSLLSGIYLITSPLANPLANYFGYRLVAMTGNICTTISLLASSFCQSYILFVLFFGIFSGIGFGLMYLPAIAIVAHWFNQRRAVAIGIALCGSGIGTCILSFLLPVVMDWVDWNGSLILISALCCQSLVGIALFRPYELHQRLKQIRKDYKRLCIQHAEYKKEQKRLKKEEKNIQALKKEQKRREKLVKKKPIVIKRGSIFTRIMEEKSRQRTVSTGSLDGMMITQMNQLVNASQVDMNGLINPQINTYNGAVDSVSSISNSLLPPNAIDRVIEAALKRLRASSKSINKKRGSIICDSTPLSKKSSANSISEMISNNENVCEDIPIELVKQYVERQKFIKDENTETNNSGISFKVGSTTLLNETDEPQKTGYLCVSQSSVSSQSNRIPTVASNTDVNSDQLSLKMSLELPYEIKKFVHDEIMKELDRPVNRKDLYFTGSLHQFLNNRNTNSNNRYLSLSNFSQNNLPACPYSCPTMNETLKVEAEFNDLPQNHSNNNTSIKASNWISDIFDFSILKSFAFQMLILSSVTMMLGFFVPFFFLPFLLSNESIHWTSATLFALGFSNIIGRLIATIYIEKGWALRYRQANGANLTVIFLGISSVSLLLMPFMYLIHVSLVVLLALIYGFCIAMIVSIRSMLVVELFGKENLTKTFTFLLIFQGLAVIVGPIISGVFCDYIFLSIGKADSAFVFSGCMFLVSTFSALTLKRIKNQLDSDQKLGKINSMSSSVMSGPVSMSNSEYNHQATQTTNLRIPCE